ncbi:MAG: ABC transporter ATP-binding protein [Chloroflexota bacterium]|nr:ABC transporter ATP-binding protein [Aggregatilineaceae bacterium]
MTEPFALACHDLSKSFGPVRAVESVSFRLENGRFLALLGPSGCGKTTVLRMIAGLERPDSGVIELAGRVVSDERAFIPPDRRRVGLVFQDYALFPHLTVAENVAYGLARGADRARRVAALLDLVGLGGYEARYPRELSGGQQQRVALARALAPQPDLILLDEPFSNLDVALRTQVREDVQRIIREAGVSAVLVTHDQDEAMSLADCVAVMFAGRIHQIGAPRALYETPVSRQVAQFLGDANLIPGTARGQIAATALGDLPLREAAHGPVEVLLRPEALELRSGGTGAPATVQRAIYHGAHQAVWLALADGATLKALAPADVEWRTGDQVRVTMRGAALAYPA